MSLNHQRESEMLWLVGHESAVYAVQDSLQDALPMIGTVDSREQAPHELLQANLKGIVALCVTNIHGYLRLWDNASVGYLRGMYATDTETPTVPTAEMYAEGLGALRGLGATGFNDYFLLAELSKRPLMIFLVLEQSEDLENDLLTLSTRPIIGSLKSTLHSLGLKSSLCLAISITPGHGLNALQTDALKELLRNSEMDLGRYSVSHDMIQAFLFANERIQNRYQKQIEDSEKEKIEHPEEVQIREPKWKWVKSFLSLFR